jgi:hypothetical protein
MAGRRIRLMGARKGQAVPRGERVDRRVAPRALASRAKPAMLTDGAVLLGFALHAIQGVGFSRPGSLRVEILHVGVRRRFEVKLILRSNVIRLGGAFRRHLRRALCALGRARRAETLRYRQQQEGSDGCCCGKSGHSLGLHECCNVCVAVWCVDLI